eukprot:TRINITY_DN13072_c0_g1_i1.p1 TRINITY_DN13072_c0_g1~~TRINITY_DN13072_c0_g1_i1.p1  ORF type:complete len:395 (+),score=67.21 TRINITY_DN13072_c0_g1_i1:75-1187(+)
MQDVAQAQKKRKTETELTKDNAEEVEDQLGHSDDPSKEQPRASQELLQQRRIVKVKRSAPVEEAQAELPKTENPFKGFNLEAPVQVAGQDQNVREKEDERTAGDQTHDKGVVSTPAPIPSPPSFAFQSSGGGFGAISAKPFSFGAANGQSIGGVSGSSTPFSFGLSPADKTEGETISFNQAFSKSPTSENGGQEGQEVGGSSTPTKVAAFMGPVQECKTGEEDDQVLFKGEGNLYQFNLGDKAWKQKGIGELKVNETPQGNSRFIFRPKGLYQLLLNASIFPSLIAQKKEGSAKTVTFGCLNHVDEQLSQFAFKFKDETKVEEFLMVVDSCKTKLMNDAATHNIEDKTQNKEQEQQQEQKQDLLNGKETG